MKDGMGWDGWGLMIMMMMARLDSAREKCLDLERTLCYFDALRVFSASGF
jgi:hypothetical protein